MVPLNIGYIAAYTQQQFGEQVSVKLFKYPADLVSAVKLQEPHVIGFSNYDWNYNVNKTIGAWYKTLRPSGIVVMGGPNIRIDLDGIKSFFKDNSYLSAYTMYQGEIPFSNFINNIINNNGFNPSNPIEGCAYMDNEGTMQLQTLSYGKQLAFPSPYLSGLLDPFLKQGLYPLLETNRGCPYACTFCTWGVAAQSKVLQHSLEQVYHEIDYVAEKAPGAIRWLFADANFGILKRDMDIAQKLGEVKRRNKDLKSIVLWDAKNNGQRNLEIGEKLGDKKARRLVAVQSLDPDVLRAIKRDNISTEELLFTVLMLKQQGTPVDTDVLVGLPGESEKSHLETLRKCFDLGFNFIQARHVILIKGSEMETDQCRQQYKIKSKFRLKQGSFGIYEGLRAFEFEESPRCTSTMSEHEFTRMRVLHWLVFWGWNTEAFKPALTFLMGKKINPVDVFLKILEGDKSAHPSASLFFEGISTDSDEEWFDSREDILSYYGNEENFNRLIDADTTYSKIVFKYLALLISNPEFYRDFLAYVQTICREFTSTAQEEEIMSDLIAFAEQRYINLEDAPNKFTERKPFQLSNPQSLKFIFGSDSKNTGTDLALYVEERDVNIIRNLFEKYNFIKNPVMALEKTLEMHVDILSYKVAKI